MNIVNIEAKAWLQISERIAYMATKMDALLEQTTDKADKKWLDNQDVCMMLNISKRTLQTYRDNGTLGYTQINHKIYYRPQELKSLIAKLEKLVQS